MSSIYENNEKIMKINFNIKEIQIVVLCLFEKIDFLKDMFEINIEKIFLNDNEINIENTFDENRFSLFKITELIINKNIKQNRNNFFRWKTCFIYTIHYYKWKRHAKNNRIFRLTHPYNDGNKFFNY